MFGLFAALMPGQIQANDLLAASNFKITVPFSESLADAELNGRLLLMISTNDEKEPRFQIGDGVDTQQIFGIDIEGFKPGETAVFDARVFGYPKSSLSQIPAGKYFVQVLFHRRRAVLHRSVDKGREFCFA